MHSLTPTRTLLLATLTLAALSTHAGTVTQGSWSPTGCGPQPEVVNLNLKDENAYNKSIDSVTAYRKAIQAYVSCLTQEANADIAAISKSANATQLAAKEANEKILADVKAAEQKFK